MPISVFSQGSANHLAADVGEAGIRSDCAMK